MRVLLRIQRGFSLAEMLIVLVIIGILALLLTPAYSTYITQYRLTAAAEALYDDINLAHSQAVKQSSGVTMVFTPGTTWCYGTTVNAACTCTTSSCELGYTTNAEYSGVTLAVTTGFAANKTQFDSARGVPTVTGSVTFSASSGQNITVSINKLGAPKICSSTVGGYSGC